MDNLKTFESFQDVPDANGYLRQIIDGEMDAQMADAVLGEYDFDGSRGNKEVDDFGWNFGDGQAIYLDFNWARDEKRAESDENTYTLTDVEITRARYYDDREGDEKDFELTGDNMYLATKWIADNLPIDDLSRNVENYLKRLKGKTTG